MYILILILILILIFIILIICIMFSSTLIKSIGLSAVTGSITEALKILLIHINISMENVLLIAMIFSYTIAYIVQRYVFCGGRFFGISLLKYCSVTLITIQLTQKLLKFMQNNKISKKYIEDKNISETRRKIYQYILINASILIVFFCIDYPLRKSFVFIKNKDSDYGYSYILYGIAFVMYICSK